MGSNVGDRLANLRAACVALPRHGVRVVRTSSVYETAPQGELRDQPDFLNACVEIDTDHGPEELLDACKEVERELGRAPRAERHGPRAIDVDVLVLGDEPYESDRLQIPHRDLLTRRFVLEPLRELAPALVADDIFAAVADQAVRRVEGSLRVAWRTAMEARDIAALSAALAPDAKLRSPITTRIRFEGRARVLELMEEVLDLLESIRVVRETRDGDIQILEVETRLAGYDIHAVQVIELDDDERVRQITLFMRPLVGVANFWSHLGPRLVRRRRGRVVAALVAPPMKLAALLIKVSDRLSPRFA